MDGDGNLDLMFRVSLDDWKTGNRTERYFWFRNTSVPPGRSGDSDLNGDGRVDHDDWMLLAHHAVYEPGEGPDTYDLDGDGDVDIHDLLEIYELYGDC